MGSGQRADQPRRISLEHSSVERRPLRRSVGRSGNPVLQPAGVDGISSTARHRTDGPQLVWN